MLAANANETIYDTMFVYTGIDTEFGCSVEHIVHVAPLYNASNRDNEQQLKLFFNN